jgi:hypothetical protein
VRTRQEAQERPFRFPGITHEKNSFARVRLARDSKGTVSWLDYPIPALWKTRTTVGKCLRLVRCSHGMHLCAYPAGFNMHRGKLPIRAEIALELGDRRGVQGKSALWLKRYGRTRRAKPMDRADALLSARPNARICLLADEARSTLRGNLLPRSSSSLLHRLRPKAEEAGLEKCAISYACFRIS